MLISIDTMAQDGVERFSPLDHHGNPSMITVSNDISTSLPDCVLDQETGLMWEVKSSDGSLRDQNWSYTWLDTDNHNSTNNDFACGNSLSSGVCRAADYLAEINKIGLCGAHDWRFPTIQKLQEVISTGHADVQNIPATSLWLENGLVFDPVYENANVKNVTDSHGIRLVRNQHLSGNLIDNNDGTVTQVSQKLMWAQCSEGQSGSACATGIPIAMSWDDALVVAQTSDLAGYQDWRLPTENELVSIVDLQHDVPVIDTTKFPATPGDLYWTDSNNSKDDSIAKSINFFDGNSSSNDKSSLLFVRLVRGEVGNHTLSTAASSLKAKASLLIPNLTPYKLSGWSDKIVVSNKTGTTTDISNLKPTDTLYLDWVIVNNGSLDAKVPVEVSLYVDGVRKSYDSCRVDYVKETLIK